jgi:Family of unknown function (DUF5767)
MEIIDLGLSDLEPVSISFNEDMPSNGSSLGAGIELLMNDKKKTSSGSMNIDLGELDKLENELNDLSNSSKAADTKSIGGLSGFGSYFGFGKEKDKESKQTTSGYEQTDSNIGQATADSMGNTKTWDGFSKINEIPQSGPSTGSRLSDREKRRKKRMMIKKIDEWYEKGLIKNNPHFNMESNYEEVEDEYETALEDKRKKDSVKLQGWWFMTAVNSLEYANSAFNPFDINLDGWGEQVNEDIDSYEEIFSELHDKYKGGKLSPEISLLLRLGFSAAVVNFTNKALSSATPAFNDVIKQSPELMKMFTNATVSSMSQASPGFNFANNIMRDATGPSMNMGPPPAPVETKSMPFSGQRPGNNNMNFMSPPQNRPDVSMGRGASASSGIDISQQYESVNRPTQIPSRPEMKGPQMSGRPEMKGPQTDIDSILSGLKTRTVDIHPPMNNQVQSQEPTSDYNAVDDSMISIASLRDMQDANMPKRSRRRNNGSRGNTISLDI